jgi:hypothetical protein
MAGGPKHELEFFLLRYVPDAVNEEFVNFGVILIGESAGFAEVRLTRDWRKILCLDPGADIEVIQSIGNEIRVRLKEPGSRADLMYRIQDLSSNVVQISARKGCLADDPAEELGVLAKMYLEPPSLRAGKRVPSARQRIVSAIRSSFEKEGIWGLIQKDIAVERYTYPGDPLKIDCLYETKSVAMSSAAVIKMFQAVALSASVDTAKTLAYSYPLLDSGIKSQIWQNDNRKAETVMTAIVENNLDMTDPAILFALGAMERANIATVAVSELPEIAQTARRELVV